MSAVDPALPAPGPGPAQPGPPPLPSSPPSAPGASRLAGHNRVGTQALTSLACAAVAAEFGVQPAEVRAEWTDDAGLLALALVAPIAVPPLASVTGARDLEPWGGTVWERAAAAKGRVLDSVASLSGAQISRVDVRISGVRVSRRVGATGQVVPVGGPGAHPVPEVGEVFHA
ncbi:hypothetical protein GCM10028789_01870 [Sinomonas halotolerans]